MSAINKDRGMSVNIFKGCLVLLGLVCVTPVWAATTYHYQCDDGSHVTLAFPQDDVAIMYYQGQLSLLQVAVSASGARYVGDGWQWWAKGVEEGNLAVMIEGEEFAHDSGKLCKVITTKQ